MKIFDFECSNFARGLMGGAVEAGGMMGMGAIGRMGMVEALSGDGSAADGSGWRNAHEFNGGAAMWSFTNIVTPRVAAEHPDWSGEEVYHESVRRWELKLFQDKVFTQKEAAHAGGEVRWEVVDTAEGRQLATRYGDDIITLKELWENTRQFAESIGKSYLFNQAEEDAQMEMQSRFVAGLATGFVSPLSHPDSIELVQVWQKDGTNSFVSKQIDLFAATGRDLSHEEGSSLIHKLATYFQQNGEITKGESLHPHFMIQSGKINEHDIKVIAQASVFGDIIPQVTRTVADASAMAALKAKETFGKFSTYLRDQIDIRVQKLRDNLYERVSPQQLFPAKNPFYPAYEFSVHERSNRVKAMMADWFISRTILKITTETGLGTGGALYWFSHLGKKEAATPAGETPNTFIEPVLFRKEKAREIKKRRSALRRAAPRRECSKGIMLEKKIKKIIGRETKITVQTHPPRAAERVVFNRKKYKKESVRMAQKETRVENKAGKEKIIRLISLVKKLIRAKEKLFIRKRNKAEIKQKPIQEKRLNIKENVLNFSITFVIWILLAKQKNVLVNEYKSIETKSDRLVSMEPTPWLLLAIIWYLAMVREHGFTKPQQVKKKKKSTKKKYVHPILRQGVIFVYAT